jgi:hypothetical protein
MVDLYGLPDGARTLGEAVARAPARWAAVVGGGVLCRGSVCSCRWAAFGCLAPGVVAGCDNVAVPTSTDGWYPRSFVLTDIVDSVWLWERDAELMSKAVARHDAMISREVVAAGGTLVRSKGEGDST